MLLIVAQGAVFAVWAVLAFRTLFRLLAIVQAETGQALPGPQGTLRALRLFLTDPRLGPDRKALGLLTLLLLVMSAVFASLS